MYSGLNSYFYHDNDISTADGSTYIDTSILPPQYTPVYYPPNPWHRASTVDKDFIVLAEFSEQEGPKPLMCVPSHGGDKFDLNAFALRIMSVDTQCMTSKFSMPVDTQVVLSETRDGIYAYVHHLILHDSQARGFVRPYCMAYVTPDKKKIMTFYEKINAEFTKVSKYLKYGNLRLFHQDMLNYLRDLKYTKERMRLGRMDTVDDCTVESVEAVENEIQAIVQTVEPLLSDRLLERRFAMMEARQKEREGGGSLLESLSLNGNFSRRKPQLVKRSYSADCEPKRYKSLNGNCDYQPRLVNVQRRTFDRTLRDIYGLCEWGAREGVGRLRQIHKYFSRDCATLLIEEQDSRYIEPQSCLLCIGRCVTINFLQNVNDSSPSGSGVLVDGLWNHDDASRYRPTAGSISRWYSTDTLESWKSAESCHSVDSGSYDKCTAVHDIRKLAASSASLVSSPSGDDLFVDATSCLGSPGDDFKDCGQVCDSAQSSPCHVTIGGKQLYSIRSSADHVASLEESSPGYGLLKFTQQHSYCLHVFNSLLIGRPVVVLGKLSRDVRATVTALSLLVPAYTGAEKSVIHCQSKPIRISDLSRVKLVGIIKPDKRCDVMVPDTIKLYVTVLDLDRRLLRAPLYEGTILRHLHLRHKNFSNDRVFLAFIHCVLLYLATKAYKFYHCYLLKQQSSADSVNSWSEDYSTNHRTGTEAALYLAKLGLKHSDAVIVQYLAEVIKIQQTEEYYANVLGLADQPSSRVQLDFQQPVFLKG